MKKLTNIALLGKALEKDEQKSIIGGKFPLGPFQCETNLYCKAMYGAGAACYQGYCYFQP